MAEFIISFVVFALVVTMMCIGLYFRRPPITGSCGGLGNIPGIKSDCAGHCRKKCRRRL